MALTVLEFTFPGNKDFSLKENWSHTGVVGSGDLEVLIEPEKMGGDVRIKIVTPVSGYDIVWEKVLGRFIEESGAGNIKIELNDNNATPFVVSLRLRQALSAFEEGE